MDWDQSVVVKKREMSLKAKLSIYRPIYVTTQSKTSAPSHQKEPVEGVWASNWDTSWRLPMRGVSGMSWRGQTRTCWEDYSFQDQIQLFLLADVSMSVMALFCSLD